MKKALFFTMAVFFAISSTFSQEKQSKPNQGAKQQTEPKNTIEKVKEMNQQDAITSDCATLSDPYSFGGIRFRNLDAMPLDDSRFLTAQVDRDNNYAGTVMIASFEGVDFEHATPVSFSNDKVYDLELVDRSLINVYFCAKK